MGLGNRLKEIRGYWQLSQKEMDVKIGISTSAYQYYERGERDVPSGVLIKITTYGVNSRWLLTGEGEPYLADDDANSENMPDSTGAPQAPIDMDFLKDVIEVVERVLSKHGLILDPPDKAEAITILYEMYRDTGKKPEERTAERVLRLAA